MKAKIFAVLLLSCLVAGLIARADDEDAPVGYNPLRKLGRGFANVLFGFIEVPNQYTKAVSEHGGGAGITYGIPKGIYRWFQREGVGFYEIVTFPVAAPRGYKPIMQPEFPNEDYEP